MNARDDTHVFLTTRNFNVVRFYQQLYLHKIVADLDTLVKPDTKQSTNTKLLLSLDFYY